MISPAAQPPRVCYVPSRAWPTERVERLVELYFARASFTQIRTELDTTHNAVIGKLDRLGILGMREPVGDLGRPPKPKPPPKIKKKPPASSINKRSHHKNGGTTDPRAYPSKYRRPEGKTYAELELEASPIEQRCSLVDLTDNKCHWPIGDPSSRDFAYCGGKAVKRPRSFSMITSAPYCAFHQQTNHHSSSNGHTPRTKRRKGKLCRGGKKFNKPTRLQLKMGMAIV